MDEKSAESAKQDAPAPRPWVTPVFQKLPLEEALSGEGGNVEDGPAIYQPS